MRWINEGSFCYCSFSLEAHGFLVPTLNQAADNALVEYIEKNPPQEDVVLISKDKGLAKRICNAVHSLLFFGEKRELAGKALVKQADPQFCFSSTGPFDESLIRSAWGFVEKEIHHRKELTRELVFHVLSKSFREICNSNSGSPFTYEQKRTIRRNLLQGFLEYGFLIQVDENRYMPATPEIINKMRAAALMERLNPVVVYQ